MAFKFFNLIANEIIKIASNYSPLAYCYLNGIRVENDDENAVEPYLKSVVHIVKWSKNLFGLEITKCNVRHGYVDEHEKKVSESYVIGNEVSVFEWFKKVEGNDHANSQHGIGRCITKKCQIILNTQ
ncbi:hypothetical protein Glove_469g20 [Diversispora epigaea]|uniref:Uncharacterized protein n=1 Tax=Diversispora epigaea TaxID=1348612 RepID=A0A397GQS9_9GLOM|nr:hypothetical protein Glove_469g20 [Diversispora epigaea]